MAPATAGATHGWRSRVLATSRCTALEVQCRLQVEYVSIVVADDAITSPEVAITEGYIGSRRQLMRKDQVKFVAKIVIRQILIRRDCHSGNDVADLVCFEVVVPKQKFCLLGWLQRQSCVGRLDVGTGNRINEAKILASSRA